MEVILIGFMGSGKTTVSKILAEKLNKTVVDMDQAIVESEKRSISEIFEDEGEEYFRKIEHEILLRVLRTHDGILATGGGTPLRIDNQQILKKCDVPVILLEASSETTYSRIKADSGRPLANGLSAKQLESVKRQRVQSYNSCADYKIITDDLTPEMVVSKVLAFVSSWNSKVKKHKCS